MIEMTDDDIELKKSVQSHSVMVKDEEGKTEFLFSKFSVWHQLKKTVAWILRFKSWLLLRTQGKDSPVAITTGSITAKEIRDAKRSIISCVQRECYNDEVKQLKSGKSAVTRQSLLRTLDPILIDGILCVRDRLEHSPAATNESKHPAILPKNHHILDVIV